MESAAEPDDPEFVNAAHCRAALHRSVASPAKEAADSGDTDDPKCSEMLLIVEQLFTDLLQLQQRKKQM